MAEKDVPFRQFKPCKALKLTVAFGARRLVKALTSNWIEILLQLNLAVRCPSRLVFSSGMFEYIRADIGRHTDQEPRFLRKLAVVLLKFA